MAVTTYVALRAVFGAGRTTIQQLARVASVEFLKTRTRGDATRAESLLTIFLALAVFFGLCVGLSVVVDNLRLLGLWLKHFDRQLFQQIALAFAITAPFFSYQVPMNLMFRTGQLAWVARRHYLFVACSALFAVISLFIRSLHIYLALLVIAEVALSISFFVPGKARTALSETGSGSIGLRVAICSSVVIGIFWLVVHNNLGGWFVYLALRPMTESYVLLFVTLLSIASLLYRRFSSHVTLLRRPFRTEPSLAVPE
jgi:hypothetical protein